MSIRRAPFIAVAALALVAQACSGGGRTTAAKPDAAYPTSYRPRPGDLLFYTNASISYNSTAKHPWIVVIDAKTKRIVAASEIAEVSSSPHGIALSPDGTSVYLPAGIGSPIPALGLPPGTKATFGSGVTVIDAVTLKVRQAIPTLDAPHHMQVLNDQLVLSDAWGVKQILFTLDPKQGNKMTHELSADPFGGRPYIGFPSPDGKSVFVTVRTPADAPEKHAWISRVDLSDWSVQRVATVGDGAVWTSFTRDQRFAYVTSGEEDWVMKVDLSNNTVVAKAPTGRGPYGAVLSPDEKRLFVVSKGEGGRGQRGGTFVAIESESMKLLEERPSCKAFVCQADHALISPDGKELWIDNNMGYVTIFDLATLRLTDEITMPLLADPHGGVFVQYDRQGKGHVVMDIGGPHGGVSPYAYDNAKGIPTLRQGLARTTWSGAAASSPLALGTATQATQQSQQQAVPSVPVKLVMEDFSWTPASVTVPKGTPVVFEMVNNGQAVHNFTSADLGIAQRDVAAGSKESVQWAGQQRTGTFRFHCTYHPGMEGTIAVQ